MAAYILENGKPKVKEPEAEAFDSELPEVSEPTPEAKPQVQKKRRPAEAAAPAEKPKPVEYSIGDDDDEDDTVDEPIVPEPKEPDEPKVYKHPSALLRVGRKFGLSDAKMASLDPDSLDAVCEGLMENFDVQQERASRPQPEAEVEETEAALLGLTEEEYEGFDPMGKKALLSIAKANKAKVKALEVELGAVKQAESKRQTQTLAQQVDAGFAALNAPLLGGKATVAKCDAKAMSRRNAVLTHLRANPIPGVSLAEAVKQTAKELFGLTEPEAPKKKKIGNVSEEDWGDASTAVPTARTAAEDPPGEARARRNAIRRGRTQIDHDDEDDEI